MASVPPGESGPLLTLIGQLDSPFVRRVAITLAVAGAPFERRRWSVFRDFSRVSDLNPLGRVPILVLENGEPLVDTGAIVDYLSWRLADRMEILPATEPQRRQLLKQVAVGTGACEKAVALVYETKHREERYSDPAWAERLARQLRTAMTWLAAHVSMPAEPKRPDQAAITAAVQHRFVCEYLPEFAAARSRDALTELAETLEATPAFRAAAFGE